MKKNKVFPPGNSADVKWLGELRYLVEASRHAHTELWSRWHQVGGLPWQQDFRGYMQQIGTLDKRPVVICIFRDKIAGSWVGFWEITSQVADFVMAEEWLAEHCPNARHKVDAQNFHIVAHDADKHDELDSAAMRKYFDFLRDMERSRQ